MIPNCCLTISLFYLDELYNLSVEPVYDEGDELLYYTFTIEYEVEDVTDELNIDLIYHEGVWSLVDGDDETLYYTLASTECPSSQMSDWTNEHNIDAPLFEDFVINQIDCQGSPSDDLIEDAVEEVKYNPCKHSNAIVKGKHILAKEVALLSGAEMLGLDSCKRDWNDAISKYLAIDALRCAPYNQYTESEERCLIGHLATNNKC